MPMIFITGISTSGKSTVAKELIKRSYDAYDTEHNGISAYFNKQTGQRAAEFGEMPERTEEWLNQHEWLIDTDWVKQKASEAKRKPIFLCGGSVNEPDVRDLCDFVIWLKTDEKTIRERVNAPRDHDYGTHPHELARAIEGNVRKQAEYENYGAIIVDARKSIDNVVDEILSSIKPLIP